MDTYQSMVQSVLDYLSNHQYCSTLVNANERCFEKLRLYLEENNISYTPEVASKWYKGSNSLSTTDLTLARVALERLKDVFETGSIRIENETMHLLSYTVLSASMKTCLSKYLDSLNSSLSERTVNNHYHSCAKFLAFVQKKGISDIKCIDIALIVDFL